MYKFKYYSMTDGAYKTATVDRDTMKKLVHEYKYGEHREKLHKLFSDFTAYVIAVLSFNA